jgi:hypothetical protein
MAYWWASQNKNYPIAIEQRTLWSCETSTGLRRRDRTALHQLEVGDLVFHYARPRVRAVSRVAARWVDAPRPDGYPKIRADDLDVGWLVRVEPVAVDLDIHWKRVAELIELGNGGPFTVSGGPAQKYLSPLSSADGERLLDEARLVLDDDDDSLFGLPASLWGGDFTDAEAVATVRKEQGELREYLLQRRTIAPCDLCGRRLPKGLLVAAHIVPRSLSSDEERRDFATIAMLACALGCDALFEWGYIVVDASGTIRSGIKPPTPELRTAVAELEGRPCAAHKANTATRFATHANLRLGRS